MANDGAQQSVFSVGISKRALVLIVSAIVAIWLIARLWEVVVIISTAFIMMAAALPYVDWLVRRGIHRVIAVLILLFAFLLFCAALAALLLPALIDEGQKVKESLPEYGASLDRQADRIGIETDFEERASNVNWDEFMSGRRAVDIGQRAIFFIVTFLSVIVISAYLLIDAPRMAEFLYRFVPAGREPNIARFLSDLQTVVGGYIRGQVITSVVIASFTAGMMLILGLPNAIAFGILSAFADILPLVGATLAIAPPVLIALDESTTDAAILLVALLLYQQFEDRYLTPKVFGNTLNLPPIIVLVTVLIGGELFGISGVLLALPAAAAARVVLDTFLDKRDLLAATRPSAKGEIFAPDEGS